MISAILLAAGMSRRMGTQNKLLLPFQGKPLILHTVEQLLLAKPDELILVSGFESQRVEGILKNLPLKIVHNPSYENGMTSSIKVGVGAASEKSDGFLICLSDQPLLPTAVYQKLMASFRIQGTNQSILSPLYNGQRGNPTLFGSAYRQAILSHPKPNGCKDILKENRKHLLHIPFDRKVLYKDVDTPEDYQNLLSDTSS
ncbi:MAG: nucleotidyltransferase family protein [Bacteroidota bacterium]